MNGVKAKIHDKVEETPKFFKAKAVPYSMRAKLEKELDQLQSEWATPVVPINKADGRVRLCGDYKVTLIRSCKLDKYPLPKIEDLFASLSGGKKFTKLDLKHTYQQIELNGESKPLTCNY